MSRLQILEYSKAAFNNRNSVERILSKLQVDPKVIVALDFFSETDVFSFVDRIDSAQCRLKIGKQLFTSTGPELLRKLSNRGFEVFLDLKFHDIPNTVAQACRAAVDIGAWMVNVHAMGGGKMLDAARDAVSSKTTKLIAVTLLTSSDQTEMDEAGLSGTPESLVLQLAKLTHQHGLDGVVCSASEAVALRQSIPGEFCLVTPGIRLADGNADDQKRILTPRQAVKDGANYLVIGRPITQAKDPAAILETINSSLEN